MKYELSFAKKDSTELLIKYKLNSIFEYAVNLSRYEIDKINKYVKYVIPKQINNYKLIIVDNEIVGCLLVENYRDGVILDEINLDKEYRHRGIGTSIIKNIIIENRITYLWVYKANKTAFNLYSKLGFKIIDETDYRYLMKFSN